MTSENVAAKYGIAREVQDKMAVSSHQRAAKARDTGRFKDEIVPVKTMWKDPKSGERLLLRIQSVEVCCMLCSGCNAQCFSIMRRHAGHVFL